MADAYQGIIEMPSMDARERDLLGALELQDDESAAPEDRAEAAAYVGHAQVRNRGTLCGSMAHADPAAELLVVFVALDGKARVRNSVAEREIKACDLFLSYLTTSVSPDELIVGAWIPEMPTGAGWSFLEFTRRFGDFAVVGVATVLVAEGEVISEARIALAGVGEKPWRMREVEEMLIGQIASEEAFKKVAGEVSARINPDSDIHASASYRKSLSGVLTRRALTQAWSRAKKEVYRCSFNN